MKKILLLIFIAFLVPQAFSESGDKSIGLKLEFVGNQLFYNDYFIIYKNSPDYKIAHNGLIIRAESTSGNLLEDFYIHNPKKVHISQIDESVIDTISSDGEFFIDNQKGGIIKKNLSFDLLIKFNYKTKIVHIFDESLDNKLISIDLSQSIYDFCKDKWNSDSDCALRDTDDDGSLDKEDIAPFDPTTYSGAEEICDEKDNDGDGLTDEEGACDAIAPVTTVIYPADWVDTDVTVSFNAVDEGGAGLKTTFFRVNGLWSQGSELNLIASGVYGVEFFSEDNKGNREAMQSVQVMIDKDVPVIKILEPLSADFSYKDSIFVDVLVSDLSEFESVISIDGEVVGNSVFVDLFDFSLGVHELSVEAVDFFGHESFKFLEFGVVDDVAPVSDSKVIGTLNSDNSFSGVVLVELSAVDEKSGVDFIEYSINDSDFIKYVEPFRLSEDGVYSVFFRAFDKAGNEEFVREVIPLVVDSFDNFNAGWDSSGEKIVFSSNRSGNNDVWVRESDGSLNQITNNSASDVQPVFSSNDSIIFVSDRAGNNDLWLKDLVSGEETQLTFDSGSDSMPDFSLTENKIVFVSDRTGFSDLWLLDLNNDSEVQLTFENSVVSAPEFSSDGRIVFSLDNQIYSFDLNGFDFNSLIQNKQRNLDSLFLNEASWNYFNDSVVFSLKENNNSDIYLARIVEGIVSGEVVDGFEGDNFNFGADGSCDNDCPKNWVHSESSSFSSSWFTEGSRSWLAEVFRSSGDSRSFAWVDGTSLIDFTDVDFVMVDYKVEVVSGSSCMEADIRFRIDGADRFMVFDVRRHDESSGKVKIDLKGVSGLHSFGFKGYIYTNEMDSSSITPCKVKFFVDNVRFSSEVPASEHLIRLTDDSAVDFEPNWNPVDSKITFTSNRNENKKQGVYELRLAKPLVITIDNSVPAGLITFNDALLDWVNHDVVVNLSAENVVGVVRTFYSVIDSEPDGMILDFVEGNEVSLNKSGLHLIQYYSQDESMTEKTKSVFVRLDKDNPVVAVNSPVERKYNALLVEKIVLDFFVSDELSGLKEFTARLNGVEVENGQEFNLLDLGVGKHEFEVIAEDVAGNEIIKEIEFEVFIDDVPPVSSNDYDGLWKTQDFYVTLTAVDELSNVKEIHFILNNGEEQVVFVSGQTASVQVLIDYEHDNSILEYWAVDEYENEEVHKKLNGIKLDKTVPQISLSLNPVKDYYLHDEPLPLIHSEDDPVVQGNPSGISGIEWLIDNQTVSEPTDVSGLLGEHSLTEIVTDNAGNQSSQSLVFVVALHLPDLFITPETLNVNPGVITVHTEWPDDLNEAVILNATLDGAPMDKVAGKELKFRRDVVESYLRSVGLILDEYFNVEGLFEFKGSQFIFYGEDEITSIQN